MKAMLGFAWAVAVVIGRGYHLDMARTQVSNCVNLLCRAGGPLISYTEPYPLLGRQVACEQGADSLDRFVEVGQPEPRCAGYPA